MIECGVTVLLYSQSSGVNVVGVRRFMRLITAVSSGIIALLLLIVGALDVVVGVLSETFLEKVAFCVVGSLAIFVGVVFLWIMYGLFFCSSEYRG